MPWPTAEERPLVIHAHGGTRTDEYHWLRDDGRTDQAVRVVIEAENAYTQERLAPLAPLIRGLHYEIASRYSADSATAEVQIGQWAYLREYRSGSERPVYVRRSIVGGQTQVVLDVNELAAGREHYQVENWAVSPDGKSVAFLEDRTGQRRHVLRIRDLETGMLRDSEVSNLADTVAWDGNDKLVLVGLDPAGRPVHLYRLHNHGRELIYTEQRPGIALSVVSERDGAGVLVRRYGPSTDELASVERFGITPLVEAIPGHRYRLRHGGEESYLLSDLTNPDYALMVGKGSELRTPASWSELYSPEPGARLTDFEVFEHFVVVLERRVSARTLRAFDRRSGTWNVYPLGVATDAVQLMGNPDYRATRVRYAVSSLIRPEQTRAIDLDTGRDTLLSTQKVNGFVRSHYTTTSLELPARDGVLIPATLAWRQSLLQQGSNPLYLMVYGAYGITLEPDFRPALVSLLDRGFIIAIAHVRGGQARGAAWHLGGRGTQKLSSFHDLLDVRSGLLEAGYGHPHRVFVRGSSAGGLIAGYVANEAPADFAGVIADRPFLDLLTTLEDDSLPLSGFERGEWGDPSEADAYHFLASISPYDQLRTQAYPAVFARAAWQDELVGYYEALKWVQRMRRLNTGRAPILIDIDMSAGHSGSTDTWRRHNANAQEFAFLLGVLCRSRTVCLTPAE